MKKPASNSGHGMVSSWRNTSAGKTQGTRFGLRLKRKQRDAWVAQEAVEIQLNLEGIEELLTVPLSSAFWRKCPEFRHECIGSWMKSQDLPIPWPRGKPHSFVIERVSGVHFLVKRLDRKR